MIAAFTIWLISVLTFVIIELPEGDMADRYVEAILTTCGAAGAGAGVNPHKLAVIRSHLGLDRPQHVRYAKWMWNLMQGDLGTSFQCRGPVDVPVKELLDDRLWLTIVFTGFTILITWSLAIPIGIYSAVRQHSVGDYIFTFLGFSGLAVPDFLLGLVLMYLAFAYFDQSVGGLNSADFQNRPWDSARFYDLLKHLWIPAVVLGTSGRFYDLLKHLWIPAVVLGTSGTASLIRVMRNNLLDELGKPYVITAKAKGMAASRLVIKYPVRVAINPLISTVGYLLPSLISGSVIVSVILSLPTLGPLLLEGIQKEDVYLAGFIILVMGVLTVLGTLLSDILLAVSDPRIKLTDG